MNRTLPLLSRSLLILVTCHFLTTSLHGQETDKLFSSWDKNGDGVLVPSEVPAEPRKIFSAVDRNGDGKVTLDEHRKGPDKNKMRQLQGQRNQRQSDRAADIQEFAIRQTWDQQPKGFDRPVYVRSPKTATERDRLPVVVYFHGNGGQASRSVNGWRELNPCIFVAPQGYERSWNIHGERSTAPDVQFMERILEEIPERFPAADMDNVVVIGSSNGGGFIYRLMIEMEEIPFRLAVPTISSLIVQQYHDDSFWMPSKSTTHYDRKITWPSDREWPRVLYFHGTDDRVVPFNGGFRGRFEHRSAQDTAHAIAKARGYKGKPISNTQGEMIEPGLIAVDYSEQDVTLFVMTGADHGLGKYRPSAARLILKEIRSQR